jgi:hypothetical protein
VRQGIQDREGRYGAGFSSRATMSLQPSADVVLFDRFGVVVDDMVCWT